MNTCAYADTHTHSHTPHTHTQVISMVKEETFVPRSKSGRGGAGTNIHKHGSNVILICSLIYVALGYIELALQHLHAHLLCCYTPLQDWGYSLIALIPKEMFGIRSQSSINPESIPECSRCYDGTHTYVMACYHTAKNQ